MQITSYLLIIKMYCMNEIAIVKVNTDELPSLAALASEIWHEHFPPIIGMEMVDYMVDKFQSESAMKNQIQSEGYQYHFLTFEGTKVGYMGFHFDEEKIFLSKLYVKKEFRGRKIARAAIQYLVNQCLSRNLKSIWLTVNRFNDNTIAAYRKMDFQIIRTQKADIGNGFFMDDYIMEKEANSPC